MIYLKIVLLFIFAFLISCKASVDYCEIFNSDQSHLYSDTLSEFENKNNLIKRKQIFIINFNILRREIKKNGFPAIGDPSFLQDTCKKDAFTATLVHIAQTRPDIFYSNSNIELFKKELSENKITSDILYTAVKIGSSNIVCDSLEDRIKFVISYLNLDSSLNQGFRFKKCN